MSIATDVSRIKGNITAALAAIADKGVTVPDGSTSDALASLIASIEAGGGSSTKDVYFGTETLNNPSSSMIIPFNIPDVIVIVGTVSGGSSDQVGLAIHIKDANGGIYQEKRRYQSTKYLIGTSATDGSLFTLSEYANIGFYIKINSGETSYGTQFGTVDYKVFAAKLF